MVTPSIGFCGMPLTTFGSGMPAASRIVGTTSMTWWNCVRISPFALIPFGQWTTSGLRVPPKWLRPAWSTGTACQRPRPADRDVRLARRAADLVDPSCWPFQPELHAEQAGDLAERAFQPAFGRGPVVADDVEDQRVVELAGLLEAVDQPADLVVGVGHVRGVVLHQPAIDALRVLGLVIPRGDLLRPRRELRALAG